MVRAAPIFVLFLMPALSGCESQAQADLKKAIERYEIVERTGSDSEKCREGRRLVEAYLEAGDEENYNLKKNMVEIGCTAAEMRARNS